MAEKIVRITLALPVEFHNQTKVAKVVARLVANGYIAAIEYPPWDIFDDQSIKAELTALGVKFAQRATNYYTWCTFVWKTRESYLSDIPAGKVIVFLDLDRVDKITGRNPKPEDAEMADQVISHVEKLARQALNLE